MLINRYEPGKNDEITQYCAIGTIVITPRIIVQMIWNVNTLFIIAFN